MNRFFLRVILVVALAAPAASFGQKVVVKSYQRQMQITRKAKHIEVSASFPEMFTKRFKHRLSSGFTSRILLEVSLLKDGQKKPVAQSILHATILYDIWEESFNVRVEGPFIQKSMQLRSMRKLIDTCGSIQNLPLKPENMSRLNEIGNYRLRIRITVNPTSEALRRKVRDYLANPEGRGHIGSPRSFFGSFSKIFVSERDFQADALYKYESQRFKLPPTS